jgi:hypothetical protein
MQRSLKAANRAERNSWRGEAGTTTANGDVRIATAATMSPHRESPATAGRGVAGSKVSSPTLVSKTPVSKTPAEADVLSIRAENVLKGLATDLTGEDPPKGRWIPSCDLLRKISYRDLQVARNCGPQTVDEILRWAGSRGVTIARPFHAGKSLSTMWRDIIARSSAGEFTRTEIAEALERSLRRKNTRIPVAFQGILIGLLNQAGK